MNKFVHFLKVTIYDPLVSSFFRFTETLILSVIIVILTIINSELHLQVLLRPVLRSLWLLLPLLVLITLVEERFRLKKRWRYILMGVAFLGIIGHYFYIRYEPSEFVDFLRYFSIVGMSAILALCVPYFPKRENFPIFVMYLATKLFATVFYAGVLYGSLVAIIASIEALFNVSLSDYIYINLFIAVVGLVAIPIFLGFVPAQDRELGLEDYHKIWKTVFSFIILPVIIAFSLILLVYIVTSTFNQNYYPDVFLIATVGVGFVGLATLLSLEPFIKETAHINFFSKYWPYLIGAITIGYFVETIRLIVQNGFSTGNATYLYLGVWLAAIVIVRIVKKPLFKFTYGQTFFLALVDTVFLISMFPFVNVVNIATYQANADFRRVLEKYDMLVDGAIVARTDLETVEQQEILAIFSSSMDIGYSRLKYLPKGFTLDQFEAVFGFQFDWYVPEEDIIQFEWSVEEEIIDVGMLPAYDYLYFIGQFPIADVTLGALSIDVDGDDYTFTHAEFTFTISMYDVVVELREGISLNYGEYPLTSLTYEGIEGTATYTLYIRGIAGLLNLTLETLTLYSCGAVLGINV